jgi:FkbM family methyltransferase
MIIRPLLRRLDLRLSRNRASLLVRREIGLGAVAEYSVSELLDRSRYLYGTYEYVYKSAFVGQIASGSIALDVGANVGEYTVLAALSAGPTGRVLAVEPNLEMRQKLLRNVELNGISNVQILPVAFGASESQGTLTVPNNSPSLGTLRSEVFADEPSTQYEVPIRRLDDLLSEEDRGRLTVMKVDVEGWELEVFQGGRETLALAKPVILYECGAELFKPQGARTLTPTMAFLEELGYRNYTIRMNRHGRWHLRPVEATPDPQQFREPWAVLMIVAVHPETQHRVRMHGQSPLRRCGIFQMLSRTHRCDEFDREIPTSAISS